MPEVEFRGLGPVKRPGGLVVEVNDGTDEYNEVNYRNSFFYDLAKAAVRLPLAA